MTKEKVLVTGGAGYVGSVLVPKLIEAGYNPAVLDTMWFGSQGLDAVRNNCEIVEGDIRDSELVRTCLKGIDSVIHLAAIANDPCSDLNPELTRQVNFEATRNLVQTAKEEGARRFVYASSSSVYGIKKELEVTEELSLEPLTIYSETKVWAEKVVTEANTKDFTTVNIRPATVCGYSPRQRLDVIVNILASAAILNRKIRVNGGEQFRPNIHIEDMADLYVDILSSPEEKIATEVFNYGGENHTVIQLAEIVNEALGGDIDIEVRPATPDSRSYRVSSKKINSVLSISPKRTIRDAVLDLKQAFEQGLISNPQNSIYRNVKRMQELKL